MMLQRLVPLVALALLGCSTTATRQYLAAGELPLCRQAHMLGRVAILPETVWRPDQKDRVERNAMAVVVRGRARVGAAGLARGSARALSTALRFQAEPRDGIVLRGGRGATRCRRQPPFTAAVHRNEAENLEVLR